MKQNRAVLPHSVDFDSNTQFWYAHDLMRALGYASWRSFQKIIMKAMGSCATFGADSAEAFAPTTMTFHDKKVRTYRLTRFACFLISMHADDTKENVARARIALATVVDQFIEQRNVKDAGLHGSMGLEERAGYLFRVTQTAARIKNRNARETRDASAIAQQVGAEVRQVMIRSNAAPESLPPAEISRRRALPQRARRSRAAGRGSSRGSSRSRVCGH